MLNRAVIPAWTVSALCAQTDYELFFPDKGGTSNPAKRVCRKCPVRRPCLELALESGDRLFGGWGGKSEKERRAINRARREKEAA